MNTASDQIIALIERIEALRNSKNLSKHDEFLIKAWERSIRVLLKNNVALFKE